MPDRGPRPGHRRAGRWDGRPTGLSRAWVADAVAGAAARPAPAGRLALLTALASYQVDQSVIDEFRPREPGDRALVELTSWASLAAARRVGSWLPIAAQPCLKADRRSRRQPINN